jgi:hypothetical protein
MLQLNLLAPLARLPSAAHITLRRSSSAAGADFSAMDKQSFPLVLLFLFPSLDG